MMAKPSIFLSRTVPPAGKTLLGEVFNVKEWKSQDRVVISREELLKGVVGVNALLVHPPDRVDKDVLDAAG